MLEYWSSPHNPAMVRLHLTRAVLHQIPELRRHRVRISLGPEGPSSWKVLFKGNISGLGGQKDLETRVMEMLRISRDTTWQELVTMAIYPDQQAAIRTRG